MGSGEGAGVRGRGIRGGPKGEREGEGGRGRGEKDLRGGGGKTRREREKYVLTTNSYLVYF